MSPTEPEKISSFCDGFSFRHGAGKNHLQRNLTWYLLQINPKRKSLPNILQNDQDLHAARFQAFGSGVAVDCILLGYSAV
jgi:hypothetical protein